MPLSIQVYKCEPANNPVMDLHPIQGEGGVENTPIIE